MGGNRLDEIQGAARDVADWVCADPSDRNRMADDLIRLVSLVVQAAGKHVAVAGESAANDAIRHGEEFPGETAEGHALYRTGERMQDGARWVADEAVGADLERYERDGLAPVWTSTRKQQHADDLATLRQDVSRARAALHALRNTGATGAQYHATLVAILSGQETPQRPSAPVLPVGRPRFPGTLSQAATRAADALRDTSPDGPGRLNVVADPDERCGWVPGDAIPACDFDPDCPVHGDVIGRRNSGRCGNPDEQDDGVPDHLYSDQCDGECCGGGVAIQTVGGRVLRVVRDVAPADLPEMPMPLRDRRVAEQAEVDEMNAAVRAVDPFVRHHLAQAYPAVPTADKPHACQPVTALDGDDRPDLGIDGKPYTICGICGLLMNGIGPDAPVEGDGHGDTSHTV